MRERVGEVSPEAVAVLNAIAARLATTAAALAGPRRAINAPGGPSWADFAAVCDALAERAGSLEALADHGEWAIHTPELGPSLRVMRTVVGCRGLYWANFRWGGPSLFGPVTSTFEVRPDGSYHGTIALREGARHSDAFFYISLGILRAWPRVLGLEPAHVQLELSPGFARYTITPPSTRSWITKTRWAIRAVLSSSALVDRLAEQNLRLAEGRREADRARAAAEDARQRAEASLQIAEIRRIEAESARATAELARRQADEALRIRGEFVSTVSHELRTPLNGILGMTQLLLDSPLPQDVREQVTTISTSGRGLLALTNGLLDFSKMEAGKLTIDPRPTDLRAVVEQVVATSAARAAGRGVDVVGHVQAGIADVLLLDDDRLRQVLGNLMDNAVKFTPAGSVVLRVDPTPEGLRFSVRDTGIGIDPANHDRVFRPFVQADASTTRQFGGTGLGLSIAKSLVQLMGGEIWVESAPGEGSHFGFAIPVSEAQVVRAPTREAVAVLADEPVRGAIEAALMALGFALGPPARVWLVDADAGLSPPEDVERCVRFARAPAGARGVLRKPVTRHDLQAALDPHVSRAPPGPVRNDSDALRVIVLDEDPVHAAVLARLLRRLGHLEQSGTPADLVVAVADSPDSAPAARLAAAERWPETRCVVVTRPAGLASLAAALPSR